MQTNDANIWDHGRWALIRRVKFDFMTKHIFERMLEHTSFEDKSVLELGSGTGRLSFLALKHGARHVTLVDSSKRALTLSRNLFESKASDYYNIVDADLFAFDPGKRFDIVFSSGVIEHFEDDDRRRVVERHVDLALEMAIMVHPTDTLYASWFNNFFLAKKLYGYQKSFSDAEMDSHLASAGADYIKSHSRFYLFYTVPFLHNWAALNRWFDKTNLGRARGGETLTCVSK